MDLTHTLLTVLSLAGLALAVALEVHRAQREKRLFRELGPQA